MKLQKNVWAQLCARLDGRWHSFKPSRCFLPSATQLEIRRCSNANLMWAGWFSALQFFFFMFFSVHTCGVPTPLTDLATVWNKVAIQPHRLQAILSCTAIPGMVSVSRLKKWETTKITEANPRRYITKIITRLNVVGNKYVLHTVHPEWQCQVKM